MVQPKSKTKGTRVKHIKTFEAFLLTEKPYSKSEIVVFDLDDTLVITDAKIKVCDKSNGKCFSLTPEEFNEFNKSMKLELSSYYFSENAKYIINTFDDDDVRLAKEYFANKGLRQ